MAIHVVCPNGHQLRVAEKYFGKRARCPKCRRVGPCSPEAADTLAAARFLAGVQPVINGDGRQTRDYVFVADVARANLLALEADYVGSVNIGTGVETDVNSLSAKLKKLTSSPLVERHGPSQPGEQRRSALNCERASRVLNWRPELALEEGLSQTVEFFQVRGHPSRSQISDHPPYAR